MNKFTIILFFQSLLFSYLFSNESLAIVTKTIGGVEYKKYSNNIIDQKLLLGSELFNEDLIKTKTDGFVKFSYLDDGTTIKIHKNSEVYVSGNITETIINKQININNGVFNFEVTKQDNDEFTIITPTSVASVKGTQFILNTNINGVDEFYGFEGIVEILNKESNSTLRLTRNIKITSLPSGEINSAIMTQQDYNLTNQILQTEENYESQEIIPEEDIDGSGFDDSSTSPNEESTVNEIRIKLTNSNGDEKELIIKYNE